MDIRITTWTRVGMQDGLGFVMVNGVVLGKSPGGVEVSGGSNTREQVVAE